MLNHDQNPEHLRNRQEHRLMLAADIASFSTRPPYLQLRLRSTLYQLVEEAAEFVGFPWADSYKEDRGDGFFAIAPDDVCINTVMDSLTHRIYSNLHSYNRNTAAENRFQLRASIHAGYLQHDDFGIAGTAPIHLMRLLDAPVLKQRLADQRTGDMAVIVSDYLFEIATDYLIIDPTHYEMVTVQVKETISPAWIWRPDSQSLPT
jgi:hypothetical protein